MTAKEYSKKIMLTETFNEARTIFIEACSTDISNSIKVGLLDILSNKTGHWEDELAVIDFYERLEKPSKALFFARRCSQNKYITNKLAALEKNCGDIEKALELSSVNFDKDPNDKVAQTILSTALNKTKSYQEARELLEPLLLRGEFSRYTMNAYASIINSITKNDDVANELCLPSLCVNICKSTTVSHFDFKRMLKLLAMYECTIGNKREHQAVEKLQIAFADYISSGKSK